MPEAAAPAVVVQDTQLELCPELHELQLRYKLALTTIKTLATIKEHPDRRAILEQACLATEFHGFRMKQAERAFFRHVNDHTAIPFIIREAVQRPHHKVFLLVQADLLIDGWPNKLSGATRKALHREKGKMYRVLENVLRCLVDILGVRLDGTGIIAGLEVIRSVKSGVWEGGRGELLQVEGVGAVKLQKLNNAGINTTRELANLEFYHIERLLSRNPPFGQTILSRLAKFPILTVRVDIIAGVDAQGRTMGNNSNQDSCTAWAARFVLGFQNKEVPRWKEKIPWTTLCVVGADGRLVWFWRGSVQRLKGGKELFFRLGARRGEQLKLTFACEGITGTAIQETFKI